MAERAKDQKIEREEERKKKKSKERERERERVVARENPEPFPPVCLD